MWIRSSIAVLLCLVGMVWILQGVNVLHGSSMSGRGGYAVLGAVVLVLGVSLGAWSWRRRARG